MFSQASYITCRELEKCSLPGAACACGGGGCLASCLSSVASAGARGSGRAVQQTVKNWEETEEVEKKNFLDFRRDFSWNPLS